VTIIRLVSCNNMQNSPLTDGVGRLNEVCTVIGLYSVFTELNSPRCWTLYCFQSF